nr:prophage tail fiber N-terminal domain-containing protein [Escherichia coli]
MSVLISGALIDGAGIPMSGCHIILKSRVNTSEVVMRTVADVVTGSRGEYCFRLRTGKYAVYLKQGWRDGDEYSVGDIAVYDDSEPGTLNDLLTALDEGDLKPDVVKRFEEMVAQAQQSAESAATARDEAVDAAAAAREFAENPLIVVPDAAALPESPHGLYLVENDEAKDGGSQIYFYPGDGRRFWFASVEDTQ